LNHSFFFDRANARYLAVKRGEALRKEMVLEDMLGGQPDEIAKPPSRTTGCDHEEQSGLAQ